MLRITFLLLHIFFYSTLVANNFAYIVIDGQTGKIVAQHKADELRPPASLTKMMTCYLLFEALHDGRITYNTKFRVSKRATQQEPCNLWLKEGDCITVKNVILALITRSANDAAVTVAEALAGSVEQFAALMTQKARSLGMTRTKFLNSSGLPNRKQVTTARDMVILSQALCRDFPKEYQFFKTKIFYYQGKPIRNHNRMLNTFKGMEGIKTGFTFASRFNLAASAARTDSNGRRVRVFAVVLGGKTSVARDKKTAELMEIAFRKRHTNTIVVESSSKKQHQQKMPDLMDETLQDNCSQDNENTDKQLEKLLHNVENQSELFSSSLHVHESSNKIELVNDPIDTLLDHPPNNSYKKGANQQQSLPKGWVKGTLQK